MAKFVFMPQQVEVEVNADCKILVAARKGKVAMRYGCVSCRCGTCGVRIAQHPENLVPMADDERELLRQMQLPTDGTIRLGCQTKIKQDTVVVDLDFQDKYSPDKGIL
ncbi:MAG: 2Fe-2S iron-sulfur cluster-binding protein [Pseudomonadota bacterium]|nr:2Fe-2S iron-sulfur cluster-binding protein [Pseudomonadota bacterium]